MFSGRVSGVPKPEVSWYKGDVQISESNPSYKMESSPDGTQKLTIFNVKKEDANAEVRCEAHNRWGEVSSDATLTVQSELFSFINWSNTTNF